MNYKKIYDDLIESRRNRIKQQGVYYEHHHILPVSLGGLDLKENMIYLTAKEHFIAHWLLWRIYRNRAMAFAFNSMCRSRTHKYTKISSRQYAEIREALSITQSAHRHEQIENGTFIWMHGKPHTPEHTAKIVATRKKRKSYIGAPGKRSDETKRKIGNAHLGMIHTKESKQKMRDTKKANPKHMSDVEKENVRIRMIGNTYSKGLKQSKETIEKRMKGQIGIPRSIVCKDNISLALTGKPKSKEHRKHLKGCQKGLKRKKVRCPFCGKDGGGGVMRRFHFDRCNQKK